MLLSMSVRKLLSRQAVFIFVRTSFLEEIIYTILEILEIVVPLRAVHIRNFSTKKLVVSLHHHDKLLVLTWSVATVVWISQVGKIREDYRTYLWIRNNGKVFQIKNVEENRNDNIVLWSLWAASSKLHWISKV